MTRPARYVPSHRGRPRRRAGTTPNSSVTGHTLFRPELQGLRAVAIGMVVCYHIWFGRVSGGVDIFLLISAFLLTGSFTRLLEARCPLTVTAYWLRAFTRLLPPAALVIVGTLLSSALLLPAERWRDLMDEAIASVLYVENWLLAARAVDYYATDHSTASPFQHFWSLSIQGQVFVLWPALFALAAFIVHRTSWRPRPVLAVIFGAITASSFVWSVYITATNQAVAYFDTRARLWEFALGSLLALALPLVEARLGYRSPTDIRVNALARTRAAASWVGLILILSAGWVLDIEGGFPGYIAAWPLLAACLVIAAGPTGTRWGADRLLSSRPLQWLGDISYALYLVHWPALVFGLVLMERVHAGAKFGTALVLASILAAWALTRLVDSPVRRSAWIKARARRGLVAVALSIAVVLAPVGAWTAKLDAEERAVRAEAIRNNPGARVLEDGYEMTADADAPVLPLPADRQRDWFSLSEPCTPLEPVPDSFTDSCRMAGNRGPLLVLVGDSRDAQFAPALVEAATEHGWRVAVVFSGGCAFRAGEGVEAKCSASNQELSRWLLEIEPDAVATSVTWLPFSGPERVTEGGPLVLQPLLDAGIDVIGYRIQARLPQHPDHCVRDHGPSCTLPVHDRFPGTMPSPQLHSSAGTLHLIDVNDRVCPDQVCQLEIGNVWVWLDRNHISATYAATLSPVVQDRLAETGWQW